MEFPIFNVISSDYFMNDFFILLFYFLFYSCSEKSTEEDGRKSNCSPREISEESKYKFNTESGFEVEEEVKSRNSM